MPDDTRSPAPSEARDAMAATIRDLASTGIKGVELACQVAVLHPRAADSLLDALGRMVTEGDLVEVEYVTPENDGGDTARVKSFYLPAGTRVRVLAEGNPVAPQGESVTRVPG